MNGRKARALRKLAGVTNVTQANRKYHPIEHTIRIREVKDPMGEVIARLRTGTLQLDADVRVIYKKLKKCM